MALLGGGGLTEREADPAPFVRTAAANAVAAELDAANISVRALVSNTSNRLIVACADEAEQWHKACSEIAAWPRNTSEARKRINPWCC
jgi:hypothetical protein